MSCEIRYTRYFTRRIGPQISLATAAPLSSRCSWPGCSAEVQDGRHRPCYICSLSSSGEPGHIVRVCWPGCGCWHECLPSTGVAVAGGSSCGASLSLHHTSAWSSAMAFFAFKRHLLRFFKTTSSLFRTRLASSSASFLHSSSNAVSSWFCSCWLWKAWPILF